jgi:hypothetical protein
MQGTGDSHVEVLQGDYLYLRALARTQSGSLQVMPGVVPLSVARLAELGMVALIGGRACITSRGIEVVLATPVEESEVSVSFRRSDLC